VRYVAYGLTLESDAPLPELPELEVGRSIPIDVRIRLAHSSGVVPQVLDIVQSRINTDGRAWIEIGRTASGYLISEAGVADFAVDQHGREIVLCRVAPGVCELTLRHTLLDWVLALVLTLRGKQVLHASAIVTPHGLCAFNGRSGAGKSTLAASFIGAGYPVLCDDCLVVEKSVRSGCFEGIPAYPGLRLWEDSVVALGLKAHVTQTVAGHMPKHRVTTEPCDSSTAAAGRQLAAVYCLARMPRGVGAEPPWIEPLDGRSALMELIACSWLCDATDKAALVNRFRFFESLAKKVPIKRLRLPDSIGLLPAVRRAVLADLAGEVEMRSGLRSTASSHSFQPRQGASHA
jgi:hypothetical protein